MSSDGSSETSLSVSGSVTLLRPPAVGPETNRLRDSPP